MSGAGADEELDETVVVDGAAPIDDAGRDPGRGAGREDAGSEGADLEGTVVVDRAAPASASERTVVIPPDQERPGGPLREQAPRPGRARRVRITLPDDTPASTRASDGAGVGARERYAPRAIPGPPTALPIEPGPDATRTPAPAMPSVARASRRAGRRALVLAAAACVVAIVGLAAIVAVLLTA